MKKFRTYYKGTMYYSHNEGYPGYLDLYHGGWLIRTVYESGDHGEDIEVDEKDVMVCIGEKDKNRVDVYSGDIARFLGYEVKQGKQIRPERIFEVENYILNWHQVHCIISGNGTLEIIGNVCENPSLLDADARGESQNEEMPLL